MDSKATHVYTNIEIAKLLRQISAAYTVLGKNKFRILAYDHAAEAIEHATSELKDLWDDNKLKDLPAIGESLAQHLDELFRTGEVKNWKQTFFKVPRAMFPLLDLPGVGPNKAYRLAIELGLKPDKAIAQLEKAANEHKISPLEGFGYKSESDIVESIAMWRRGEVKSDRILLSQALEIAETITDYLRSCTEVIKIESLGSLRRQVSTIGDIDIAVATKKPENILDKFVAYPKKRQIIERGPTGASLLLTSGQQVDLRVCDPDQWGSMLQYFTGSKQHNIHLRSYAQSRGLSLSEYGIKTKSVLKKFSDEKSFYAYLKMDWVPPELREDTGEIEAALSHKLPQLVQQSDIRGDLHMHSDFNQDISHDAGLDSVESLCNFAQKLNYEYIGITNHNPKSGTSVFEKLDSQKIKVLNLMEVDVWPSGQLAVSDQILNLLDGCLVSVHSSFGLSKKEMTKRVLAGLSHPKARIFAHPTGRLLNRREGYELDWEQIFAFCEKNNKALEINACPNRLDLPDVLVREAVKRGVLLSLGTDAHAKESLLDMSFGVSVARRGWAENKNVINTWDYAKILAWFRQGR